MRHSTFAACSALLAVNAYAAQISFTYATTATVSSPAGTYPIVPSLVDPGNKLSNYMITVNNGILAVTAPVAPAILSLASIGDTNLVITWSSISNSVYRVQCKDSLTSTNWINLAPDITATGSTASYTDHSVAVPQRFYRVVLVSDLTPLTPLAVVANSSWRSYGATNPAGTNGQWTFTESSSSFPRRFFRAATP